MTAKQFDNFSDSADELFQIILQHGSLLNSGMLLDTENLRLSGVNRALSGCHEDLRFLLSLLQYRLEREGKFEPTFDDRVMEACLKEVVEGVPTSRSIFDHE